MRVNYCAILPNMDTGGNIFPGSPFGARTTPEPLVADGSASGVRSPYLWVLLWLILIVLIAGGFWYFMMRGQDQTDEEIIERSSARASRSQLTDEQRFAIAAQSSASASSTSTMTPATRKSIMERSSAPATSEGQTGLTPTQRDALIRSSSVPVR